MELIHAKIIIIIIEELRDYVVYIMNGKKLFQILKIKVALLITLFPNYSILF